MKIKFTWKIWLWLIVLVLALVSIFITPNFLQKGILITNVEQNSSAFEQGLRQGQVITAVDNQEIKSVEDYSRIIQEKFPSNEKIKTIITASNTEYTLYSNIIPEITVSDISSTNLKTGLDLSGGARALVKAENHDLTSAEVNDLVSVVSNRLNVYGISDMTIRPVSDLAGNNFMLIEIAGATPKDLEDLISQQGKFEAKIGDEIVFIGGERDITSVARSGQESGIYSCSENAQGGFFCEFRFVVYLSEEAAQRHADITKDIPVNSTSQGNYLSEKLDLYLDDKLVDSLLISEGLKGRVTTQIAISGPGTGETNSDAYDDALEQMNKLQTILITGSLPFKLEIVKLDTISPTLGENFSKYIFYAGIASLLLVGVVIFIKYRRIKLVLPSFLICTSEIVITLGVASIMGQDLDLPGIAGILAAIGTGIDDQIVILDETQQKESMNIKQKIKRAFAIILGAYLTVLVSLLPLLWAGAGLLRGFAIMTIIGITIGVLITRPAFADLIKMVEKED
ncbi:MAG: PDZ domain-containing protein [Candidatus Nanoarchaeia archaeon]|nr:PDZ domain-containing protein [Candidatus Nanoarchaeia archaeon]MDD5358097.1 PDZ domain-containing protein [Candidatus Nanoarchaeia archaeon]MDD5589285.1 PDZ domain-containing protein [Candidatus Nanoarchaeia archaeon]